MIETFESLRPRLFGIAYRMLGSASEAEDIVQEAFLRFQTAERQSIRSEEAFLRTIVTRLCLDQLKSAQAKRETYPGPWLPEPILTEESSGLGDPAEQASRYDSLSMAFLLLLESLSPEERAVFLLREVFDYEYSEIAAMLDKSEVSCRQLVSRAKKHVVEHRPRFEASPEEHRQIVARFASAAQDGDLEGLMALLAEGVTTYADGGGKRRAATRPIRGREVVARFILRGLQLSLKRGETFERAVINGREGFILRDVERQVTDVLTFEIADGLIQNLYFVLNPDKLTRVQVKD
jgi:RNA polymerase sigma-70 factor (ECF subfamily)